jgi:hypothetical protein
MAPKDDLKNFNHVDLLFPSKYVKAADLRGKTVVVYIERIQPREKLMMAGGKSDTKPVIFLRGKDKGWILNKTNARSIAKVYGPELTNWLGKPVAIMSTQVEARGEVVDAIRVDVNGTRAAASKAGASTAPAPEAAPEQGSDDFADAVDEQALADAAAEAERS